MGKYTEVSQYAPISEKLHSYTTNGECWEYNGCINNHGYCLIMADGKLQYAHRLAWEFHNNQKIPKGMTVDHICFNRKCINPKHLRLLSHKDNCGRQRRLRRKLWCDKHNCERRKYSYWNSRVGRKTDRWVCNMCAAEYSKKYKAKKRGRVAEMANATSCKDVLCKFESCPVLQNDKIA